MFPQGREPKNSAVGEAGKSRLGEESAIE